MARETQEGTEMEVGEVNEKAEDLPPSSLKLYEAQFFGFTPQTCMLRVYSAFHDCLCDILPVVEKVCLRQLGKVSPGPDEQLRARECSRRLQQFLEDRFKQLSQRMDSLLMMRCLSVPPNVLLPEDHSHKNYPQHIQEVQKLDSSLADLQRAYEEEVCALQALQAELDEQAEVQKQLDGIVTWVRELQAAWEKEGNGCFHESFRVVMESVKKLQEAVREACHKAPH
ncbi:protein MIS12 homolog [Pseudochaenichthys georgianus]|uniref:protein MIS12 homolog n=1 Tax=Pseudochaenichthys georgianus TaxID=52239 RepID=UPI00146B0655|nr:protein MIS12 homolog [Pseudochaenichthys georgianus]